MRHDNNPARGFALVELTTPVLGILFVCPTCWLGVLLIVCPTY